MVCVSEVKKVCLGTRLAVFRLHVHVHVRISMT